MLFFSEHHNKGHAPHTAASEAAKRMAARSAMGFAAGALRQTAAAQARVAPQMVPRAIGQQTRTMGELPLHHVQKAWSICTPHPHKPFLFFYQFPRALSPSAVAATPACVAASNIR